MILTAIAALFMLGLAAVGVVVLAVIVKAFRSKSPTQSQAALVTSVREFVDEADDIPQHVLQELREALRAKREAAKKTEAVELIKEVAGSLEESAAK